MISMRYGLLLMWLTWAATGLAETTILVETESD